MFYYYTKNADGERVWVTPIHPHQFLKLLDVSELLEYRRFGSRSEMEQFAQEAGIGVLSY